MDILEICGLQVKTRIGAYAWEQQIDQILIIDIKIPLNCANCNEQLQNTLDYNFFCLKTTSYIESKAFVLIESVAHETALMLKEHFKLAEIILSVSKPHAIKNAANIKVTVIR